MTWYVDAIEPYGRPMRRTVKLEVGEEVAMWALPLSPDGGGLRRTVVRGPEDNPPPGAHVVMWVVATEDGLQVSNTGRAVTAELIRPDHRSRVVAGMRLPTSANLELVLPDDSHVPMTLQFRRALAQGAAVGVAGGGTRKTRVVYGADNVWWLITDSKGILVTITINLWDRIRDRLMALGIDSRVLTFMSGVLLSAAGGVFASYVQYQRAETQTERADEAETALARAQAAQEAALATETACLDQRKELVTKLGQLEAKQGLAARMALSFGLASKMAGELGGEQLGEARLLESDGLLQPGLVSATVNEIAEYQGDPTACLAQEAAISNDLPRYLLLYHPDPTLVCPLDYAVVDGNVDRRGRFGLSNRMAREFGSAGNESTGTDTETLDDLLGDARLEDRWSAFTLAIGYRKTAQLLLRGTGERPPVLPSQSQLWTLALLDAYNAMPSTPGGALDGDLEMCMTRLLEDRDRNLPPSAPGEALFPDIVSVALGEAEVAAQPTPGCPWGRDAIRQGARNALRAAGRLASLTLEEEED